MVLAAALVVALLLIVARPAAAAPLDEPFVGGMSFDGPTSANLGAIYWNPAALGLVRGFQLTAGRVRRGCRPSTSEPACRAAPRRPAT